MWKCGGVKGKFEIVMIRSVIVIFPSARRQGGGNLAVKVCGNLAVKVFGAFQSVIM